MSGYRESHLDKGEDYHSIFTDLPRVAMIWDLEQRSLASVVSQYFPIASPSHLDFACGTGRVLSFLRPHVTESVGVDVSESMLNVARVNAPDSTLICADLTRENPLQGRRFDLITAFRFFPNAEPELRREVIEVLSPMLTARGVLVFNNHQNHGSIRNRVVRSLGKDVGHTMTDSDVAGLLHLGGLVALQKHGMGFLPLLDRHRRTMRLARGFERQLAHAQPLALMAEDVLYVARVAQS